MADLNRIFILHTTSTRDDADTDAHFELVINSDDPNNPFDVRMDFPSLPHNAREQGCTDEYMFDVTDKGVTTESKMKIRMKDTDDGWLPQTMWVIGQTREGTFELLAAYSEWSDGWFDRGDGAVGPDEHLIAPWPPR